jgi:hypothetical protein
VRARGFTEGAVLLRQTNTKIGGIKRLNAQDVKKLDDIRQFVMDQGMTNLSVNIVGVYDDNSRVHVYFTAPSSQRHTEEGVTAVLALPDWLAASVAELAAKEHRSISNQINILLENSLNKEGKEESEGQKES